MKQWPDMITLALLGVERGQATFEVPASFEELMNEADPSGRLLRAAGVLQLAAKAGWRPPLSKAARPEPAPTEELIPVSDPQLVSLLARILDEARPPLVNEACELLARKSHCLPPRLLPRTLELGRKIVSVRGPLQRVLGRRGAWLAAQNPDWKFALFAGNETADRRLWDEGDASQRAAYLAGFRRIDPGGARELLEQSFASETARDRAGLLPGLAEDLTFADESFLAATLIGDRSKEVRQAAARLLSRLPESGFAKRMVERLTPCVRVERKKLRLSIAVEPPGAFSEDWEQDGIEEKPPATLKMGERAWWLLQFVTWTPLRWWEEKLQLPPAKILELISRSDWKEPLLEGLRAASCNQPGHADWTLALLENGNLPHQEAVALAKALPFSAADAAFQHLLRNTDDSLQAGEIIEAADFPWSGELWSIARKNLPRWLAQEDWRFRNALVLLACRLPLEALSAPVPWPEAPLFADAMADFSRIVDQRKMLKQTLTK